MSGLDFHVALRHELNAVTALGNRVYPLNAPEARAGNGVPYLIYATSEGLRTKTIGEGYRSGRRVAGELNVIGADYDNMKSTAAAVLDVLISFEGREIGTDGPFIQELTYEDPVELYEDKPKLYRCVIDFDIYFDQGG